MINRTLKTLSLSSLALALAAAASANGQKSVLEMATGAVAADRMACATPTQQAIDRGWELQRELLEARLAAKGPDSVEIPGTIIVPPLPGFGVQDKAGSKGRLEITAKAPVQEGR